MREPKPPQSYQDFIHRYPELGEAWDAIHRAGENAGPLDAKTQRLLKLAIGIGAKQRGAVGAAVRKGLAEGITVEEMEQVVALAAGAIGLPATVMAYGWVHDTAEKID